MAAAAELPPSVMVAELEADPRMAETWLRVLERNARDAKRKADEQRNKSK